MKKNYCFFFVLLSIFLLTSTFIARSQSSSKGPVSYNKKDFLNKWEHFVFKDLNDKKSKSYKKFETFRWEKSPDPKIDLGKYESKVLFNTGENKVILMVPTQTWSKGLAVENKCHSNHSWIVTLPSKKKTKVDFNPNCSDSYNANDSGIILYKLAQEPFPFVSIDINGPACIGAYLYGFDSLKKSYHLLKETCGD